jgi:hypothetical protein
VAARGVPERFLNPNKAAEKKDEAEKTTGQGEATGEAASELDKSSSSKEDSSEADAIATPAAQPVQTSV